MSVAGRKTAKTQSLSKSEISLHQPEADRLQGAIDRFIIKLEKERREGALLDHSISQLETQILAKKDRTLASAETRRLRFQIADLERKYQLQLAKVGEVRSGNRDMRIKIDDIRREQQSFHVVMSRVSNEIGENSSKAESANHQWRRGSRIAALQHRQAHILRSKSVNERFSYIQRIQEMSEVIQKDGEDKSNYLRKVEDLFQEVLKRPVDHIDLTPVQTALLEKWSRKVRDKKSVLEAYIKRINSLEEAFGQIKNATGIARIPEIVTAFIKSEEQQYALYTHVNDQSAEIDALEDGVNRHKRVICAFHDLGLSGETQAREIESDLKKRVSRIGESVEITQSSLERVREVLETLQTPAKALYDLVVSAGESFGLVQKTDSSLFSGTDLMSLLGRAEECLELLLTGQVQGGSIQWSLDQLSPKKFSPGKITVSPIQITETQPPDEEEIDQIKVPLNEAQFRERVRKLNEAANPNSRSKSVSQW